MGAGDADAGDVLARAYRGRRVLLTGHTGFCGTWTALWLAALGAEVHGLSQPPPTAPSLHDQVGAARLGLASTTTGDIRDADLVASVVRATRPEVVLHLAAQPLVLASLDDPVGTFATNVMGTAHVLEALRRDPDVRACVVVTTDKCYRPGPTAHREGDPLGGHEPYSASKAGAELVVDAYRAALLRADLGVATARAGNVIGGGDWAADRLVPDCARALAARRPVHVRSPRSVRPWQHVLDAVAGYLRIGAALLDDPLAHGRAWNLGPSVPGATVLEVVDELLAAWRTAGLPVEAPVVDRPTSTVEAPVLQLDATDAGRLLGWRPRLDPVDAIRWTARWYAAFVADPAFDAWAATAAQLDAYRSLATPAPVAGGPR